jgi:hypothetical protein
VPHGKAGWGGFLIVIVVAPLPSGNRDYHDCLLVLLVVAHLDPGALQEVIVALALLVAVKR